MADALPPAAPAPVGVLLAAGRSTRFGSPKMRAPLCDGTPMGVASAMALRTAVGRVLIVLPDGDAALHALFVAAGFAEFARAPANGDMAASLVAGVRATPDAAGWLVALGDMPLIRPATCRAVAAAVVDGALLAAPSFEGRRGHPVGFAAPLRDELLALRGDAGARSVLDRHRRSLRELPCDDPGVLQDFDTPEALLRSGRPAG